MSQLSDLEFRLNSVWPILNERQRRLIAATEAMSYGYGGISAVQRVCGISRVTITKGINELEEGLGDKHPERIRVEGGGRHKVEEQHPEITMKLCNMVEETTRGDPEAPLRWTCKSTRNIASELTADCCPVSHAKVAKLLKEMGYSLQGNKKTKEGDDHVDRDAQFQFIAKVVSTAMKRGDPVVSVDTKKRELIGEYCNNGKVWRKKGDPEEVNGHDFPGPQVPRAYPYGIYDIGQNRGFVNVGTDHDTSAFAVASIKGWWIHEGRSLYAAPKELLITADGGGSNGYRTRLWKVELQKLADFLGFSIRVSHFPPGTSKWNKIEHRLFSFISSNWRGQPLKDYETIVSLISNTTTAQGLTVKCRLDRRRYPTGRKVDDEQYRAVKMTKSKFHGEWNYTISPS